MFNSSSAIVLRSQFLVRHIVEAGLSLTSFVAGDTRHNLKSIVITEKSSLLTPEHCNTRTKNWLFIRFDNSSPQ